jgi:ATP-dependent protease HslVU (ClpYQ) ATPase subunit
MSMVIVVAFQVLDYMKSDRYQTSSDDARKAAAIDRQSLKALVHQSNLKNEQIDIKISQHSIHTDGELGSINGNLTKLLKQILNETHAINLALSR